MLARKKSKNISAKGLEIPAELQALIKSRKLEPIPSKRFILPRSSGFLIDRILSECNTSRAVI